MDSNGEPYSIDRSTHNEEECERPGVVFLIYFPRSGSTFLSSRLDQYEDIGVTVESELMRTLILNERSIREARGPGEVYDLLEGKGRIRNLGLRREEFRRSLREGGRYSVEEVTNALLSTYFDARKPDCKVWVVKDGVNGRWINQVSRAVPSARFLHLVRDGRAVLNSGLRSRRAYNRNERMARDSLTAARRWTSFVSKVDRYALENPGDLLECRYEDFIAREDREIARIRDFLGLAAGNRTTDQNLYYESMPEREKSLHQLITEDPVDERIDAWKKELPRGSLLAFEYRVSRVLKRHDYEVADRSLLSLLFDKAFIVTFAVSVMARILGWLRLLLEPARLRRMINSEILYRKDRSS